MKAIAVGLVFWVAGVLTMLSSCFVTDKESRFDVRFSGFIVMAGGILIGKVAIIFIKWKAKQEGGEK